MKLKAVVKKTLSLLSVVSVMSLTALVGFSASAQTAWDGTVAASYAGGTGTQQDPYQISTASQFAYLAEQVNAGNGYQGSYFTLTADISLSGHNWTPVGHVTDPTQYLYVAFDGVLNGAGHKVTGITIGTKDARDSNYAQGLFGCLHTDAVVENMGVDATIYSSSGGTAGGLAGINNGSVVNCYATGSVNAAGTIPHYIITLGSLVGENDGSIANSYATGSVSDSDNANTGGLVGYNIGTITNCYAVGNVEGNDIANSGGFVGLCVKTGVITNGYWNSDAAQTVKGAPVDTKVGVPSAVDTSTGMAANDMKTAAFASTLTANRSDTAVQVSWIQDSGRNGGFPLLAGIGDGRSFDAALSGLTISSGTLNFDTATPTYSVNVDADVASVTVTPTANESHAAIMVNGTAVESGHASGSIALTAGSASAITIQVTAQDGTQKAYTVNVTRASETTQASGTTATSSDSSTTTAVSTATTTQGTVESPKTGAGLPAAPFAVAGFAVLAAAVALSRHHKKA